MLRQVVISAQVYPACSLENFKMRPLEILHLIDQDELLKALNYLCLVPVLIAAEGQVFARANTGDVLLLKELTLIAIFWHEKDVCSDLLTDRQENIEVSVAEIREVLDNRSKIS